MSSATLRAASSILASATRAASGAWRGDALGAGRLERDLAHAVGEGVVDAHRQPAHAPPPPRPPPAPRARSAGLPRGRPAPPRRRCARAAGRRRRPGCPGASRRTPGRPAAGIRRRARAGWPRSSPSTAPAAPAAACGTRVRVAAEQQARHDDHGERGRQPRHEHAAGRRVDGERRGDRRGRQGGPAAREREQRGPPSAATADPADGARSQSSACTTAAAARARSMSRRAGTGRPYRCRGAPASASRARSPHPLGLRQIHSRGRRRRRGASLPSPP